MTDARVAANGTWRPRARGDVTAVVLDGEAVIHRAGRVHALDPVATLVWRCCDGDASVDQIAAELAEVFAAPRATVTRDVAAVVDELAALGLLTADSGEPDGDDVGNVSMPGLLVHPPGSCASCADKDWATRSTYRIGSRLISVGTDNARADAALRAALAANLVPTPAGAESLPPFFAVTLPEPAAARGPQPLCLLQRGDTVVARSRHPGDVLRALIGHLASFGDLDALGLATVNGLVVGRGGRAMIVPDPDDPIRYRHALARHGVLVADLPVAIVDRASGDVVVGAPGLDVDHSAIDALTSATAIESGAAPEPLPWGRYRVVALGVTEPPSGAAALLRLGPARGDHRDHDAMFAALLALIDAVPIVETVDPDAIAAVLART